MVLHPIILQTLNVLIVKQNLGHILISHHYHGEAGSVDVVNLTAQDLTII